MNHSPWLRECLTAQAVGFALVLLRRASPRVGELWEAIPMTLVPAMVWACSEQGRDFAAAAAACGVAVFLAPRLHGQGARVWRLPRSPQWI